MRHVRKFRMTFVGAVCRQGGHKNLKHMLRSTTECFRPKMISVKPLFMQRANMKYFLNYFSFSVWFFYLTVSWVGLSKGVFSKYLFSMLSIWYPILSKFYLLSVLSFLSENFIFFTFSSLVTYIMYLSNSKQIEWKISVCLRLTSNRTDY